ncbi:MAG: cation:proton antiporter [Spirochaetales bacterium]|nr:cation:proton antiporter [Spirochaetales bacterium]
MDFSLVFVVILLGGWLSGRLFGKIGLPSILGMVVFGIGCSLFLTSHTPQLLWDVAPCLKSFALIVILLRAGLGLNKDALKKNGRIALLLAFLPCLAEGAALTLAIHYVFHFDFYTAGLTAFMLSAVSPAVIVPSMLDLKSRGIGKEKDVPTIILAGASVDDVVAITLFTVFLDLALSGQVDILRAVLSVPLSLVLGIAAGAAAGFLLLRFFRRYHEDIRATEKTLVLVMAGTLLVDLGDSAHFAALIGLMTIGFIVLEKSELIAKELAGKLSKIWVFAEIILFVLIGFSLDVTVALHGGLKALAVLAIGLAFRSLAVWLSTAGSHLTRRERLFCVIAYLPKATVQAALGGVALSRGIPEGDTILALAVMAILVTTPVGLIGIRKLGRPLLEGA